MTKIYLSLLLASLFSSCTTLHYLGNAYQPTKNVDVFVDETAIAREYTIMGKGYVSSYSDAIPESLQQKAINKAMQKGADAVLFQDYFVPAAPSKSRNKKDSSGHVTVSFSSPSLQPANPEVVVLFLKYK